MCVQNVYEQQISFAAFSLPNPLCHFHRIWGPVRQGSQIGYYAFIFLAFVLANFIHIHGYNWCILFAICSTPIDSKFNWLILKVSQLDTLTFNGVLTSHGADLCSSSFQQHLVCFYVWSKAYKVDWTLLDIRTNVCLCDMARRVLSVLADGHYIKLPCICRRSYQILLDLNRPVVARISPSLLPRVHI